MGECYRVEPGRRPWVALVGAGPGDPGLLTRRAAELLAAADVVVHDRLVGAGVLTLSRPDASLVYVGKCKGGGWSQDRIDELILARYRDGARVVRLKGGDPFLFGRGIEEVRAARAAGIAVEVVPGVSSALAAPALGGVAVTERGVSAQVTIVSGHRCDGEYDWGRLARSEGTIVVLMAATTGPDVARRLLGGGMPPGVPVAVIADASYPSQTVLRTDLEGLATRRSPLPNPAVLVIGTVAGPARPDRYRSPDARAAEGGV